MTDHSLGIPPVDQRAASSGWGAQLGSILRGPHFEVVARRQAGEGALQDPVRGLDLDLKIELGRAAMTLKEALRLESGSVVTLDRAVGDPVDVVVDGRLVARGEVMALNGRFCVRITQLIEGEG